MSLIPPQFLDAVVAIGITSGKDRDWIGTGFFYGIPAGGNQYTVFLITNRHVLDGLRLAWIRLNSQADNSTKEYRLDVLFKNGRPMWVGHPDPDVDIAALWINAGFLQRDRRRFSFFMEDQNVLDGITLQKSSIAEGDGVFLLGYPMGLVGANHYVICRSGSIARIKDVKEGTGRKILLDGMVFPGNSGGPVVLRPTMHAIAGTKAHKSADLLGIVTSYVPYKDVAYSAQTKRPKVIFEENSGLSVIHPSQLIIETVAAAAKRHRTRINRANAKKAKGGP